MITGQETLGNLHAIVGRSTQKNFDAAGPLAVIGKLEEVQGPPGVSLQWPFDNGGLRNILNIDRTAGGKI